MTTGPGTRDARHDLADLVEDLRAAGFPVGVSEAIDATRLLLRLGEESPALDDAVRLRARLRPVFCKSKEQQQDFDRHFDDWWSRQGLGEDTADAADQAPVQAARPPQRREDERPSVPRWLTIVLTVAVVAMVAYAASQRRTPPPAPPPQRPVTERPAGDLPAAVTPGAARGPAVDRFVPAVRYNVEVWPPWIWLLVALPIAALLSIGLPVLVLSRTRHRRRAEPMFLDASKLARDARRLVPTMPADITDRLARHVRSQGIDIERIARRPLVDLRRTLEATIRNHGIPTLRFSVARIHPSYLVLVDLENEQNPRGRLFYQWAERLQREGLAVEMLLLRRTAAGEGGEDVLHVCDAKLAGRGAPRWSPFSRLRRPRFGERLIVVSDGDPLVDAAGTWRPAATRASLHRWRDRALFTPVEPRDWGVREESIERSEHAADPGFIVLPLEESALGAWTDLVVTGQLSMVTLSDPQRFPALLRQGRHDRFVAGDAPEAEVIERLMHQLRVYLGEQGFYWLTALAVTPIVRWELTLLLGEAALARLPRLEKKKDLHDALARNYRRLVRLPWLQREALPDWLRLRLLVELSQVQQRELRTVVEGLLEKLSPRAVPHAIELEFERPPGTSVDLRDERPGVPPRAGGDALYLGYMSGISAEQLALRAPRAWGSWARGMLRVRGWRRFREEVRAFVARFLWVSGLPHLGFNRRRLLVLVPCLLLLATGLIAAHKLAPVLPLVAAHRAYVEGTHLRVIAARSADALAFSPDGRRLVSGGIDDTLRIWDATTGAPIGAPLAGHTDDVVSVAYSPDGRRLVSGSLDRTLRVWNAETGEPGAVLTGHTGTVWSVAFSPDRRDRVVSGGADGTVRLWDVESGVQVGQPLRAYPGDLVAVAISRDGQVASVSIVGYVWRWNTSTGLAGPLPHRGRVSSVAYSPDGRYLVLAGSDGTLEVWNAQSGTPAREQLRGHSSDVQNLAFFSDGRRLVSSSKDGTLRVWNTQTWEPIGRPLPGDGGPIRAMAVSPDGQRLASASDDETIRFWDAQPGTAVGRPMQPAGKVWSLAFSPDGTLLASGESDGRVTFWDAESGTAQGGAMSGDSTVLSVAFSPDGLRLVSGTFDEALRLWDVQTRRPVRAIGEGLISRALTVAFSRDGRTIAAGSEGFLYQWDAQTGGARDPTVYTKSPAVRSTVLGASGTCQPTAAEGAVRVWDADSTSENVLRAGDLLSGVAMSPDRRRLAACGEDGALQLWDVRTVTRTANLRGHTENVTSVAFAPDGRRLVSGGNDATLRLWDAETGEPIGSAMPTEDPVTALAFSPGGEYLAVATEARPETTASVQQDEEPAAQGPQESAPAPYAQTVATGVPAIRLWRIASSSPESRAGVGAVRDTVLGVVRARERPWLWLLGGGIVFAVAAVVAAERRAIRLIGSQG